MWGGTQLRAPLSRPGKTSLLQRLRSRIPWGDETGSLTVPNITNPASERQREQSMLDSVDIDALIAGFNETGVTSGCAVTAQGTPNMTVHVAAGVAVIDSTLVTIAAADPVVTTAHATNPRFDIVVAHDDGTVSVVAGTAAALTPAPGPVFPAIPAGATILAAIYVSAAMASVTSADIVDKRVVRLPPVTHDSLPDVTEDQHHPRAHADDPDHTGPNKHRFGIISAMGAALTTYLQRAITGLFAGDSVKLTQTDDPTNSKQDLRFDALGLSIAMHSGTASSWAAMPAAITVLFGQVYRITQASLTAMKQVRCIAYITVVGTSTARLVPQYSVDSGTTWKYFDGTTVDPGAGNGGGCAINTTGLKVGTWLTLPTPAADEAKADVWVRVAGIGGDGSTAPTIGSVFIQFK